MKFTLKSKTHVFGALVGVFGGLLTLLPTVQQHIHKDWYGFIFIGISVIAIVLRNVTTTPINQK